MLSRVAENLYWFGRSLERAENAARAADVEYQTSLESGVVPAATFSAWDALIAAAGSRTAFEAARRQNPQLTAADFFVLSEANPNSIRSTVTNARHLARALREHVSREVWEETNALYLDLQRVDAVVESQLFDLAGGIKRRIQTIFGLFDNTVLFDEGREWFRSGLYLERAEMTSRLLDAKYHLVLPSENEVGGPLDRFQWMAILRSASAWEAYRKSGDVAITGPDVIELLALSSSFPRSLHFCVRALHRHAMNAMSDTPPWQRVEVERPVTLLELQLGAMSIDGIVESGVHEFLRSVQNQLRQVDNALRDHVFRILPEAVS